MRRVLFLAVLCSASGCAATVSYPEPAAPGDAVTVVPYTGVRRETRRFPDYSPIDRKILAGAP